MNDRTRIQRQRIASSAPAQPMFGRSRLNPSPFAASTLTASATLPDLASVPPVGHDFRHVAVGLQPKLTISQPHDSAEQEADRVADQVMRMENPESIGQLALRSIQRSVQRKCAACESEESPDRSVNQVLQSGGQPLDQVTRSFMEPRFGHDFSQVRVHQDSQASQSAQALNARAYTVGQDVVFGAGQYAPNTDAGQHLLAHELTHVVQQSSGEAAIAPSLNPQLIQRQAVTEEDDRDMAAAPEGVSQPAEPQTQAQSEVTPVAETESANQTANSDSETPADSGESNANVNSNINSDADSALVEPLPNVAGEGEPSELVAYAKSVRLQGRTNASFKNSFTTQGITTELGTGCTRCGKSACVHATGTVESTFSVSTTVTLPRVSDFPKLTPCQRERVQDGIDTVLSPHEQQHVDAFHTYDGTVSTPFDLTICRDNFNAQIQSIHNVLQQSRRTAAQSASDALDPFQFDVDLDCTD